MAIKKSPNDWGSFVRKNLALFLWQVGHARSCQADEVALAAIPPRFDPDLSRVFSFLVIPERDHRDPPAAGFLHFQAPQVHVVAIEQPFSRFQEVGRHAVDHDADGRHPILIAQYFQLFDPFLVGRTLFRTFP